MTIAQIKARLTIREVLNYYGMEVNKNGMVNCPFHSDRKASMRVYEETNTVYCFAGGCGVSYLDVIDFMMRVDGSSKRSAIMKAKEMIGELPSSPGIRKSEKVITAHYPVSKENYSSSPLDPFTSPAPIDFNVYRQGLRGSKSAQNYCGERFLDWAVQEIGYQSRQSKDRWGRGCIIFPLRNAEGEIVSLYGRSIFSKGHYYQTNRSGLYPAYPPAQTRTLVLCESVIDAASLERVKLDLSSYSVLALYGTNGLTAEHLEAIQGLEYLEEIVFALDGDDAGVKAMKGYGDSLAQLLPEVGQSTVSVPPGEDVNSLIVGHDNYQGLMKKLFAGREILYRPLPRDQREKGTLDSSDPHNLIYTGAHARYYVKGGVRHSVKDLDALKVTLVGENKAGRKSRQKLDLYEDKQVEKVSRYMGEKLGLRSDLIELDLQALTDELEVYQRNLYESSKSSSDSSKESEYEMSEAERTAALSFLRSENLLARINEGIGSCGIVGEEKTRLLLFIVASSYQMRHTLHALIQGSSGSGKTRLLQVIRSLLPEEVVKSYTRVTDGSFYNQGEYYFVHKLVCLEDIDGLKEEALLAVRELQSNEILRTSSSGKNEQGKVEGIELVVRGPIASMSCTTRAEVYEDNISRCFVVAVDESREQDERIIKYQNRKAAGLLDASKGELFANTIQNAMRLLQPLEVLNPYAHKIELPKSAHKIRRLNELYQSFVRQLTLLHQYQRQRDEVGRVITEKIDLELACEILFESIVLKVDELDGSLRQFYESLKRYVIKQCECSTNRNQLKNYEFTRFEVRQATGVSKTQQHRYLRKLVELEYLRQYGHGNRGYRYKIVHWDDMERMRQQIRDHLGKQLKEL